MMEELKGKGWTELLEGTSCHMPQKMSDKRQEHISKRGDNIVLLVYILGFWKFGTFFGLC